MPGLKSLFLLNQWMLLIFLLQLAPLLLEVPGVMFPLPLNQWELQTLVLLLVISLLFFTTTLWTPLVLELMESTNRCNAPSSAESVVSRPAVSPPADDPLVCRTSELGMVTI